MWLIRSFFLLALGLSLVLLTANWLDLVQFHRVDDGLISQRPMSVGSIQVRQRGQFCVLFNFTQAQLQYRDINSATISLAVHSSLHLAHKLDVQAQHWDGLISAAILVRPDEEPALGALLTLWHCSRWMRRTVSLHLVWRLGPFQEATGCGDLLSSADHRLPTDKFVCPPEDQLNSALAGALNWPPMRYPINTLRNVARIGAVPSSRVHIVADVENIFSDNFTAMVAKYVDAIVEGPASKQLFAFRRFEVEEGQLPPTNLDRLAAFIENGLWDLKGAFPFHRHYFPGAHRIAGLPDWLAYSRSNQTLRARPLPFVNAAFEPQFLMSAQAPLHFEDVPARLYDHQVLLLELCRAGYRLQLLSHVFNVHSGVRRGLSDAEKLLKWIAAKQSWRLLEDFRQYLEQKYGEEDEQSALNCPNFWGRLNLFASNSSR